MSAQERAQQMLSQVDKEVSQSMSYHPFHSL